MDSGNFLFIICEPCHKANEADFGFKLAMRDIIGGYSPFGPAKHTQQLTAWFHKHRTCGGKGHPDHFQLGHAQDRDYDQPKRRPIERSLKAVN